MRGDQFDDVLNGVHMDDGDLCANEAHDDPHGDHKGRDAPNDARKEDDDPYGQLLHVEYVS